MPEAMPKRYRQLDSLESIGVIVALASFALAIWLMFGGQ
jgi:hypothetical protein